MAVLTAEERRRVWAHLMRTLADLAPLTITKADLRAAVDATDTWIDSNAAAYNTAIPQPARNALTAQQKTLIFCYVAMRRAGVLRVLEDG